MLIKASKMNDSCITLDVAVIPSFHTTNSIYMLMQNAMKLLARKKYIQTHLYTQHKHTQCLQVQTHAHSQRDQQTKKYHLTQQSWHILENSEQLRGDGWTVLQSHQPAWLQGTEWNKQGKWEVKRKNKRERVQRSLSIGLSNLAKLHVRSLSTLMHFWVQIISWSRENIF